MDSSIAKMLTPTFRTGWTKHFDFPIVNSKMIGGRAFHWTGKEWTKGVSKEVWVFPGERKRVEDPPVKYKTTSGSVRMYTRQGFSLKVPEENVSRVAVGNQVYTVVLALGIYEVHFGVGRYSVLGLWGYEENTGEVSIFTPVGVDCIKYGADVLDPGYFVEEKGEVEFNTSPAYSYEPVYQPAPEDLPEETPMEVKRKQSAITRTIVKVQVPPHSVEFVEQQERAVKERDRLAALYADKVSPTTEVKVKAYAVKDGKLAPLDRHRSSIEAEENELGFVPVGARTFEDPLEKARKLFRLDEKGTLPLPTGGGPYVPPFSLADL